MTSFELAKNKSIQSWRKQRDQQSQENVFLFFVSTLNRFRHVSKAMRRLTLYFHHSQEPVHLHVTCEKLHFSFSYVINRHLHIEEPLSWEKSLSVFSAFCLFFALLSDCEIICYLLVKLKSLLVVENKLLSCKMCIHLTSKELKICLFRQMTTESVGVSQWIFALGID